MAWYCPSCGQPADRAGTCSSDATVLAPVSSHDLLGRRLGDYTVVAALGEGSYGRVFRAIQPRSGLTVAIKLLHRPISDVESQRVVTEARAAAMIRHPNVVQVYDLALTSDRCPYIVMQHLTGIPMSRWLAGPMPIERVIPLAEGVLRGLAAAHAQGVVHRDLKPENIFVSPSGHPTIVDFGLAKLLADPRAPNLTQTGESIGTPCYMAPEQIRGKGVDRRADVYAAGVILYEAFAGHAPFSAPTTFALFDAHLNRPVPPLAPQRPDLPRAMVDVIERALAKDPDARFADADAMLRALTGRPRRRVWWPYPVAAAVGATVMALALTAAHHAPDGPAPQAPLKFPANDAPPAEKYEFVLQMTERNLASGAWTTGNMLQVLCPVDVALRTSAGDPTYRAYLQRYAALIRAHLPAGVTLTCSTPPGH